MVLTRCPLKGPPRTQRESRAIAGQGLGRRLSALKIAEHFLDYFVEQIGLLDQRPAPFASMKVLLYCRELLVWQAAEAIKFDFIFREVIGYTHGAAKQHCNAIMFRARVKTNRRTYARRGRS